MEHLKPNRAHVDATNGPPNDIPPFAPTIDTHDVFRSLIADELRHGRLNRAHRRRIVGYAARLGLTAVQTGRLIEECREDALHSRDPVERRHALRLIEAEEPLVSTHTKIALVVGAALLVDWILIRWVW